MKNLMIIMGAFGLLLLSVSCDRVDRAENALKLWYDRPALKWEEALPLGNGRLGAMVFGRAGDELYQLNDLSLWSGKLEGWDNPNSVEDLPLVREAVDRGDYRAAADIWMKNCQGAFSSVYMPMADLSLRMLTDAAGDYYRDLNLQDATSTVRYTAEGVGYRRTAFISYPDQVMVIRLEADKKQALSFDLSLTSKLRHDVCTDEGGKTLELTGKSPHYKAVRGYEDPQIIYSDNYGEGIDFKVTTRVLNDGTLTVGDTLLSVRGATTATIILSAGTNFEDIINPGQKKIFPALAERRLDEACAMSYKELLGRHRADYEPLFSGVELSLGGVAGRDSLPTNERLSAFGKDDSDNGMVELYYQFGRYLTIASSRSGSIPSNLQGLWNPHIQPPWNSNYTVNINTEMNYWPVESTNLPECHLPLLNFLERLSKNGEKTARVNFGFDKGWVAHHNSDVWAQSAPPGYTGAPARTHPRTPTRTCTPVWGSAPSPGGR